MLCIRRWHVGTALLFTWSLATNILSATGATTNCDKVGQPCFEVIGGASQASVSVSRTVLCVEGCPTLSKSSLGITTHPVAESRTDIAPRKQEQQYIAQIQNPKVNYAVVLPADDSRVPQSKRQLYQEDAFQLALRLLQAAEPENSVVELPTQLVQTLYNALIHVYNATNLPARSAVVQTYNIHTFPRSVTRSLIVGLDRSQAWIAAWRNGQRLTGNPLVDALMVSFGLRLNSYVEYRALDSSYAVLEAERSLNIAALAFRFAKSAGVRYAHPNSVAGDGNDINAQPLKNYWQLDYSLGYGDCPSGCIKRYRWTFRVAPNGLVNYVGSSGTLPSAPISVLPGATIIRDKADTR